MGDASVIINVSRAGDNQITDGDSVALAWKSLTVTADSKPRPLISNATGKVQGGFTAIMGPSGSGKTTLMNALACRLDKHTKASGDMRLNGNTYTSAELKRMSGYVLQDDLLNGDLTVEETLLYTAQLRLPPIATKDEQKQIVHSIINEMGLTHVRGTCIGSPMKRGVSGGERKRVCVAMELLTQPKLLFLDEPTSGLDSVAAMSLCSTLKSIARERHVTILCTIHQPQSKIFALFDNVIILNQGQDVYQGPPTSALSFYATSGFPLPPRTNPADHLLDVITPPLHAGRDAMLQNVKKLQDNFSPPEVDLQSSTDEPLPFTRELLPWPRQVAILMDRCAKDAWRKRSRSIIQLIQMIVMAILIGFVFKDLGHDQNSISKRQALLFFCVINQGIFGALSVINTFPAERVLVLRERAAGTYSASAYYIAKLSIDLIMQIVNPIIFSCIVYWLVNLQHSASKFFIFMGFMILCSLAATSLALMVSATTRSTSTAVVVLPMYLEVCRLFGGFFLPPANMPSYFVWLDALSYVKYTYVGIALNELMGLDYTCTEKQLVKGVCPITTGEQRIQTLGLDAFTMAECAGILVGFIFICRFIAYLGVRYIKW